MKRFELRHVFGNYQGLELVWGCLKRYGYQTSGRVSRLLSRILQTNPGAHPATNSVDEDLSLGQNGRGVKLIT